MTRVNVADFKRAMGEYLTKVIDGEEVIVMKREVPVARVVKYEAERGSGLTIADPSLDLGPVLRSLENLPRSTIDPLDLLAEDRG